VVPGGFGIKSIENYIKVPLLIKNMPIYVLKTAFVV
jgi:hypothetical protein